MTAVGKKAAGAEGGYNKMELKMLSQDKEKCTFLLKGVDASYVNALRRTIIEEVPVMAIDEIEFRKNSSILYDEVIAHRMGLLPLKTDLKSYMLPEECKCEGKGCNRCQLKLTLKSSKQGMVYASELKSKDPAVKPIYPDTPIVKLLKGQDLELEATAVLGKGKAHSKWAPGHVFYKNTAEIDISSKCDGCDKCVEACPKTVLELKDNKASVIKDNLMDCHLCLACQDICPQGAIRVNSGSDFIVTIESWGQLSLKEIISTASDILNQNLDELSKSLKA